MADHTGHVWVYVLGTVGALISAAYMGRLVFLTLFGKARTQEAEGAHESPAIMTIPLVLLAVGAFGLGLFVQRSPEGVFSRWVEPLLGAVPSGTAGLPTPVLSLVATVIAAGTLVATWVIYASGRVDWMALRVRLASIQRLLANGWYIDDYYATVLVAPGKAASAILAYRFDAGFIDGAVNGIGSGTRRLAAAGRKIQTGFVRTYALALFAGAVSILVYVGLRL